MEAFDLIRLQRFCTEHDNADGRAVPPDGLTQGKTVHSGQHDVQHGHVEARRRAEHRQTCSALAASVTS